MKRVVLSLRKSSSKLYFIYTSKLSWAAEIKLSKRHTTKKDVSEQFLQLLSLQDEKNDSLNFRQLQLLIALWIQLSMKNNSLVSPAFSRLISPPGQVNYCIFCECALSHLPRKIKLQNAAPMAPRNTTDSFPHFSSPFRLTVFQEDRTVFCSSS